MKLLFISRAYPPVIGGMENQNFELGRSLSKLAQVKIIANKRGKLFLPIFLPLCLMRVLCLLHACDAVLLGDGVLGCIGWCIKMISKKPVLSVVHGLDLTYNNSLYQKLFVNIFLKKIDRLIAVGNETRAVGIKKGIAAGRIVFVPNGVDTEKELKPSTKNDIAHLLGEDLAGKKLILTSGRLSRRKGVAWFINSVMPQLPEDIIYIVAGDGPDKARIAEAIEKNNLSSRVKMLGLVTDEHRDMLLTGCDIFIQPNIRIAGDMEGFGISVIEAGFCRLPVIASRIEGLQDAIKDKQNGILIEPYDAQGFAAGIRDLLENDDYRIKFGEKARAYVIANYSWQMIARQYLGEIRYLLPDS